MLHIFVTYCCTASMVFIMKFQALYLPCVKCKRCQSIFSYAPDCEAGGRPGSGQMAFCFTCVCVCVVLCACVSLRVCICECVCVFLSVCVCLFRGAFAQPPPPASG